MRLRRLLVEGFAQLGETEIFFRDDAPNLIIGPNEAGKSHLMQVFYAMFFGLEHPDRFIPWFGPATMRALLEFVDGNGRLVRLEQDLRSGAVRVMEDGGEPWTAKIGPRRRGVGTQRFARHLEHWLGFPEQDIFTATTFVRQDEIIRADLDGVAPEVKRLITGTVEADYEQVRTDLRKQLDALRKRPNGHTPRALELKREELRQLEETYRAAAAGQQVVARLQQRRDAIRDDLAAKQQQLEAGEERLQRAGELVDAEAKLAALAKQFKELQERKERLETFRRNLRRAEETLARLAAVAETDIRTLDWREQEVTHVEEQLRTVSPAVAELDPTTLAELDRAVTDAENRLEQQGWPNEITALQLTQLDHAVREAEADLKAADQQLQAIAMNDTVLDHLDTRLREVEGHVQMVQSGPQQRTSFLRTTWLVALAAGAVAILLAFAFHPAAILLLPVAGFVVYRYRSAPRVASGEEVARTQAELARVWQERRDWRTRMGIETDEDVVILQQRQEQATAALAAAQQARTQLLQRLGTGSVKDALQRRAEYDRLLEDLSRARQTRTGVLARLGVVTTTDALTSRERYQRGLEDLAEARRECQEVLDRLGVATMDEARAMRTHYDSALTDARTAQAQLEALGDEAAIEREWQQVGLEQSRQELYVKHLLATEVALRGLAAPEARVTYFQRLEREAAELKRAIEDLKVEQMGIDRELYVKGNDEQDVATLLLQIEDTRREVARLEQHVAALEIALETLDRCVAEFHDHCLGGVGDDTSHFLATITDGRYSRVHLDPKDLEPTVDMPHRLGIPSLSLSRGVRDQLYFALRVALARSVSGGRSLPLVLDDPFVNFDPQRLERVVALLGEIVQRTQVILFTCDPQYLRWLEPVKELRRAASPVDRLKKPDIA